jgi:hypothetical protein
MLRLVESPQTGFNTSSSSFSDPNGVLRTPPATSNTGINSGFTNGFTNNTNNFSGINTGNNFNTGFTNGLTPTTPTTQPTIDPMLQATYKAALSTLNLDQKIKDAINTIYTQKGSTPQAAEFAINAVLNEPQLAQFKIAFQYYSEHPEALQQNTNNSLQGTSNGISSLNTSGIGTTSLGTTSSFGSFG